MLNMSSRRKTYCPFYSLSLLPLLSLLLLPNKHRSYNYCLDGIKVEQSLLLQLFILVVAVVGPLMVLAANAIEIYHGGSIHEINKHQ